MDPDLPKFYAKIHGVLKNRTGRETSGPFFCWFKIGYLVVPFIGPFRSLCYAERHVIFFEMDFVHFCDPVL